LKHNTVVGTVMSNLGFTRAMEAAGISVVHTAVGDRYVLESMRENGFNLGGEQSGHVIMGDYATTGDGVLTALHLAAEIVSSGRSIAELAGQMTRLPQVLINVSGVDKSAAGSDEELQSEITQIEQELGSEGRVLLRPSGTEPVVRVMVEAATSEQAHDVAERLARVVRARLTL
ncbi:MAG: phosphoglucosamine mutase, partial [Aeromicrobium sp.]